MRTNFKSDSSYYKKQEEIKERKQGNETKRIDTNLLKIRKYLSKNSNLDINVLIKVLINRQLVTKDKLTKEQLFNSTRELIEEMLGEIECTT